MNRNKSILVLGLLAFALLLLLSIIYYKERIIFLDPAFQLSYMIRDGGFAIQVNRFAAVISKIFPYIAIKLAMPLRSIVLIYSMSFVIYNFILFIIIIKWLKNSVWALFLLLYNILMISHSFYWPAIELNQGIAIMILYFALLDKRSSIGDTFSYILIALLVPSVVFSHPLVIIAFVFVTGYLFLFKRDILQMPRFYAGTILAFISYVINKIFFRNWYDDMNMERLDNFGKLFPDYINLKSNSDFVEYLFSDYYLSFILLVLIIGTFLISKRYKRIVYILSFIFIYIVVVNVSFPEGVPHFFAESKYQLLGIFIITALAMDIIDMINSKVMFFSLLFIIAIRIIHINNSHSLYSARLDLLRDIMHETGDEKLILSESELPKDTIIMSWASAYEFWLLSALENQHQRSIIIDENPSRFDSLLDKKDIFIEEWRIYPYSVLPERYFKLDSTTVYKKGSIKKYK